MYIAGINVHSVLGRLPVSHNQGVESLAWLSTVAGMSLSYTYQKRAAKLAKDNETGDADMSSLTPFKKALTPIHSLALLGPAVVYLVGTAFNRMEQPDWFADWELPRGDLSVGWHAGLRTLGCVLHAGSLYFFSQAFKHLGSQWHFIAVSFHSFVSSFFFESHLFYLILLAPPIPLDSGLTFLID